MTAKKTPAKKRAAKKRAAKKRPAKRDKAERGLRGAALTKARKAVVTVGQDGPLPAPVPIALSIENVRAAIASRNPLALCTHATPAALAEALLDAATDPENVTWADVLKAADVPWFAWVSMRRQTPTEATLLFQVWACRVADNAAVGTLGIADNISGQATAEEIAAARAKIGARTWLAERLDPEVYGTRTQTNAQVTHDGAVEIVLRDEIE